MNTDHTIKDSISDGWVEHMPALIRPYLRLSRYDRPIGFWLLALPGWIGLAFAALSHGYIISDLRWAALIGIGAIAMRGAGCTYNDIVDRDLDRRVERTALRPLAAGTISLKSAWIWLVLQCLVGLAVLAFFPRLSQIIALSSLVLVAAYPFMKRITFWPQAWLGLTFNWAVLVAYSAKTGTIDLPLFILYTGLVFWTIGYDTIYACQDIEDDAMIGVKSTARLFGMYIKIGVYLCYITSVVLIGVAVLKLAPALVCSVQETGIPNWCATHPGEFSVFSALFNCIVILPFASHLFIIQMYTFDPKCGRSCLYIFKSNRFAALSLIIMMLLRSAV